MNLKLIVKLTRSRYENSALLNKLIDLGVDINAQDVNGQTALMCAISELNIFVSVKTLLEQEGVDLELRDNNGRSAIDYFPEAYKRGSSCGLQLMVEELKQLCCRLMKQFVR